MIEGTNRSDFMLRVIQAKQLLESDKDSEVIGLIEDLEAAFERAFAFAFQLKGTKTKHLQQIGELLRLDLINDKEGTKEYLLSIGIKPKVKEPLGMDFEEM
jgi:hypothetical protein